MKIKKKKEREGERETKFSHKPKTTILLNIFLLHVNFDKFIIRLHFLLIFFILENFLENLYQ